MAESLEMQIFGTNVEKTLTALGWSKQHLADLAGLHRPHVSRIIHGHDSITVQTASTISHALGVSLSDLFREDYEPSEHLTTHAA